MLLSIIDELKRTMLYSEELGIELKKNNDDGLFKWFLASILFGARISETIAKNTYRAFEKYNLLEPQKILKAGWDFLVDPIMREGGYVRYDFKTSTKILKICEYLIGEYGGSLRNALRKIALKKGYTLNEYGLFTLKDKKWVAGRTEKELYNKLGFEWIPPEERLGENELEKYKKK